MEVYDMSWDIGILYQSDEGSDDKDNHNIE